MSEEEDDYMSDKFVVTGTKQDLRPGLIHNRSQQRMHTNMKKKLVTDEENKTKFTPYRVVEQKRREEGLQEALGSENKGFALMQKMGYTPGSSIGKSGAGCIEPINITVKSGREGLGRDSEIREIKAKKLALRAKMADQRKKLVNTEDYQSRFSRQNAERQLITDLKKCQRVCQSLDTDQGCEAARECWFWPDTPKPCQENEEEYDEATTIKETDDDDDDDVTSTAEDADDENSSGSEMIEMEPEEKLAILSYYLRTTHHYCVWCGTKYEDYKDLQENCPGSSRDKH